MLYGHDSDKVIGRWENISISDGKLSADALFDSEDAFAKEIERKVEKGFLKGCSIGIIINDAKYIDATNELLVTKWELLEASVVSVPADPGAIVFYNEKHEVLSLDQAKQNFSINTKNRYHMNEIKLTDKTLATLAVAEGCTPEDVEKAIQKKDEKIAELQTELQAAQDGAVDAYLTGAVKGGKITEAEKTEFLSLAKTNFDAVKRIVDSKPERASASLAQMAAAAQANAPAGRESWDYMKWMKEDSKGLQKLKAENPAEFERLKASIQ
jgi:HK97 family phage prohead protease